jgi:hypothetical protein
MARIKKLKTYNSELSFYMGKNMLHNIIKTKYANLKKVNLKFLQAEIL